MKEGKKLYNLCVDIKIGEGMKKMLTSKLASHQWSRGGESTGSVNKEKEDILPA